MLLYVKKFLSIFVSETGGLGSMTSFTREFVTETNITVDSILGGIEAMNRFYPEIKWKMGATGSDIEDYNSFFGNFENRQSSFSQVKLQELVMVF